MLEQLKPFFRLVRPVNLLIIAATMFAMRYFILRPLLLEAGSTLTLSLFDFCLLTLSMVLMAASGNIINDYFDVRVDKINKPSRVIIDKGVKRRVAMGAHQVINVVSILIVVYLSFKHSTWWPIAIPVLLISGLWFYSSSLQKMFLIGNVTVSLLVATVPLWAGVFELGLLDRSHFTYWTVLGLIALFAFLITLIRELVKDIEDAHGDKEQGYRTMAIVWGTNKTKRFAAGWAALLFIMATNLGFRFYASTALGHNTVLLVAYVLMVAMPMFLLLIGVVRAKQQSDFTKVSRLAKWSMAVALLFTPIWAYVVAGF